MAAMEQHTLLVIDDQPMIRDILVDALSRESFKVLSAASAETRQARTRRKGNKDGPEAGIVARRVARLLRNVPILHSFLGVPESMQISHAEQVFPECLSTGRLTSP